MEAEDSMAREETSYQAGSTIFEEGSVEDKMYLIKEGKVEILKNMGKNKHVVAVLGKGDFFGEMALVTKTPRYASARAVDDTTLIGFNRKQFLTLVKNRSDLALKIIDGLILRLEEANEKIRKLIQKNQNALVFDSLCKCIQVKDKSPDIHAASEWVSSQLGMKIRETEATIRKLIMLDFISLNNNRITIKKPDSEYDLRTLLED